MASEIPKDIIDPDKLDATAPVDTRRSKESLDGGRFASFMQEGGNEVGPKQTSPTQGASPIDIGSKPPSAPPTLDSVRAQMTTASSSLGDIKNQLHTKGLQLKQSQKYLLRNKLGQANEQIRSAAEHLGVNPGPLPDVKGKKNPIAKFLELVSDGQDQLNSAATQVRNLDSSGKQLNAGELLLVQVKLQKAQQELDYSSAILGKAVDIISKLFNVQI